MAHFLPKFPPRRRQWQTLGIHQGNHQIIGEHNQEGYTQSEEDYQGEDQCQKRRGEQLT